MLAQDISGTQRGPIPLEFGSPQEATADDRATINALDPPALRDVFLQRQIRSVLCQTAEVAAVVASRHPTRFAAPLAHPPTRPLLTVTLPTSAFLRCRRPLLDHSGSRQTTSLPGGGIHGLLEQPSRLRRPCLLRVPRPQNQDRDKTGHARHYNPRPPRQRPSNPFHRSAYTEDHDFSGDQHDNPFPHTAMLGTRWVPSYISPLH